MKIPRCKGTKDLSPEEMEIFRRIERAFRSCCLGWGYQEVRTPTIEYLHLFTAAGKLTPSMLSKVYSFLDWDGWSGERVVLRPDSTIPVARFYIDRMENKELAKLFYVDNIFIFEETGKQTRERWQCGAELIGVGSPLADAELVTLSLEVLKKLKIDNAELRLSHAGLLKALLARLGLNAEEQTEVFDQILDGNASVLADLTRKSPELGESLLPLLDLKGQSAGFLRNFKAICTRDFPEIENHLDNFISIVDFLENLGCDYKIAVASGAGFEYYTGMVFQLFVGEEKIGGGGRYDSLIPAMGGRDVPASGFALYVDRLMNLVKNGAMGESVTQKVLVRVNSEDTKALKQAFSVATYLHEAGYIAGLDLGGEVPADWRWIIDVAGETFTLQDKAKSGRVEVKTIKEVLISLGKKDADKNSPT